MSIISNRIIQSAFPVVVLLAGCGASTGKIKEHLNSFTCTTEQFVQIDNAVNASINLKNYRSQDGSVYDLFQSMNSKLAEKCSPQVLAQCSPGNTVVRRGGETVEGPIKAFGVIAQMTKIEVPRFDGSARVLEEKTVYNITIEEKAFRTTMGCFQRATNP
jgi:hypothetical protein